MHHISVHMLAFNSGWIMFSVDSSDNARWLFLKCYVAFPRTAAFFTKHANVFFFCATKREISKTMNERVCALPKTTTSTPLAPPLVNPKRASSPRRMPPCYSCNFTTAPRLRGPNRSCVPRNALVSVDKKEKSAQKRQQRLRWRRAKRGARENQARRSIACRRARAPPSTTGMHCCDDAQRRRDKRDSRSLDRPRDRGLAWVLGFKEACIPHTRETAVD